MKNKRENSERYGCDCCKSTRCSTEHFDGYVGGTLWICDKCYKKLIDPKHKKLE